jgi:broad specificity phosphatase PhoE
MPDVLLVRHAETAWTGRRYCGRSDPPLTDLGVAAANRLAATLAPTLPTGIRIVSSPRRRARQTAEAIAAAVAPASIEIDARWAEVDFGIAEGLTYEELEQVAPVLAAALLAGDVEIDWPGGETAASLATRVEAAWRDVSASDWHTLVISHGGPLRMAIALATGVESRFVDVPKPATMRRPPGRPAAMSQVRAGPRASG